MSGSVSLTTHSHLFTDCQSTRLMSFVSVTPTPLHFGQLWLMALPFITAVCMFECMCWAPGSSLPGCLKRARGAFFCCSRGRLWLGGFITHMADLIHCIHCPVQANRVFGLMACMYCQRGVKMKQKSKEGGMEFKTSLKRVIWHTLAYLIAVMLCLPSLITQTRGQWMSWNSISGWTKSS